MEAIMSDEIDKVFNEYNKYKEPLATLGQPSAYDAFTFGFERAEAKAQEVLECILEKIEKKQIKSASGPFLYLDEILEILKSQPIAKSEPISKTLVKDDDCPGELRKVSEGDVKKLAGESARKTLEALSGAIEEDVAQCLAEHDTRIQALEPANPRDLIQRIDTLHAKEEIIKEALKD